MSDILLVTVGTSAIYNAEIGGTPDGPVDRQELARLVKSFRGPLEWQPDRKRVDAQQKRLRPQLTEPLLAAHKQFWSQKPAYLHDPRNRRQTSAELISTYWLLNKLERKFERILLVASDSEEGELAAVVDQRVMQDCWRIAQVHLHRVKGLDRELRQTTQAVEDFLAEVGVRETDQACFNITGGYKGAIPAITLVAMRRGWSLFYLHESGEEAHVVSFEERSPPPRVTEEWFEL